MPQQVRIAFTAGRWADGAVICRATQNRAGPSVVQEFGPFETWTQADSFATALNEGIGVCAEEARVIVTSSHLATMGVFESVARRKSVWDWAPVLIMANSIQVRLLAAKLRLALTYCRMARSVESDSTAQALAGKARRLVNFAAVVLPGLNVAEDMCSELCDLLETLRDEMRALRSDALHSE